MKKLFLTLSLVLIAFSGLKAQSFMTKTGHVKFFSKTVAENITAHNYKVMSTFDLETGVMVFSVPIQSFEFEKSMMQKHFNQENYMDSKKYPKAKFKGKITNLGDVNFGEKGTYNVTITGDLTIKGVTKNITEKGTLHVNFKVKKEIHAKSTFNVTIADYGVGKPPKKNAAKVADVVKVTVDLNYKLKY